MRVDVDSVALDPIFVPVAGCLALRDCLQSLTEQLGRLDMQGHLLLQHEHRFVSVVAARSHYASRQFSPAYSAGFDGRDVREDVAALVDDEDLDPSPFGRLDLRRRTALVNGLAEFGVIDI